MKLSGLSTPALILDVNILKENARAMEQLLEGSSLGLRPHYKSHKCAALAQWPVKSGAVGMTCAKLSEAEDLCDAGIEDILIANQVVEPAKLRALADLAVNCRLTVCVDSEENIQALSRAAENSGATVGCLVEYDIGMARCGVTEPEAVLALARRIQAAPHLEFRGIQAYAGHISHVENPTLRKQMTGENSEKLKALLALFRQGQIPVQTLSGGSTGTAALKAEEGLYTELQAGSYLFMDATYSNLALPFQNSLFLLTTVVSRREGLTVVDAGVKTCGVDQGMPGVARGSVGHIVASEEHFQLHNYSESVAVGEKLRLIPGHCCSTVNLHDKIYLVDGEQVVGRLAVTGRGFGK